MHEEKLVQNNGYIEHIVPDIGINKINMFPYNLHDTLDIFVQDDNQEIQVLFVAQRCYEDNEGYEEIVQHKQDAIGDDVPIDASNLQQFDSHDYLDFLNVSQIVYVHENNKKVKGDVVSHDCFKEYHVFDMFQEKNNFIGRLEITKKHIGF